MNGQGSVEGFGNWNNDAKEPKKDREQRQRERKSRWGDAEPEETAEATETSLPELETCAPPTVTDNTDMDIETEAPEYEDSVPAGIAEAEGQPHESVPTEQLFQPPIHETSASEEQIFQTPVQENNAADVQENDHADPSEIIPVRRNSDVEDVMENQIPAPETSNDISESSNPPSER